MSQQPAITYEAVPVSVVCSCGSPVVRQSTPREYRVYRCHACKARIYVPRRYATGSAEELPAEWKTSNTIQETRR